MQTEKKHKPIQKSSQNNLKNCEKSQKNESKKRGRPIKDINL